VNGAHTGVVERWGVIILLREFTFRFCLHWAANAGKTFGFGKASSESGTVAAAAAAETAMAPNRPASPARARRVQPSMITSLLSL
jgi:hypothetical protein